MFKAIFLASLLWLYFSYLHNTANLVLRSFDGIKTTYITAIEHSPQLVNLY